jgi:hypothetical protein
LQGQPFEITSLVEDLRSPAILLRRGFEVTQHGANINRFAEVCTLVFAESLHGQLQAEGREGRKGFVFVATFADFA